MATREYSIRLHPETYEALEVEANRRHVPPDELADEIVRGQLPQAQVRPGQMREALDALLDFSQEMPRVDAVELIREVREEASDRGLRWQSS